MLFERQYSICIIYKNTEMEEALNTNYYTLAICQDQFIMQFR